MQLSAAQTSGSRRRGRQAARVSEREQTNQLPADENKDTRRQGKDSHYYRWNGDRGDECNNANKDEINCQQQHSDVFGEVHSVSSEANAFILHAQKSLVLDRVSLVNESATRIWKKIAVFYGLTMLFAAVFDVFVLHAGRMDAGNFLYVTGAMWSPALAAFATKRIFRERIGDLPWRWSGPRYAWLAYLIPIGYSLPVYLIVWLTGLGGFYDVDFAKKIAEQFGWANLPPISFSRFSCC